MADPPTGNGGSRGIRPATEEAVFAATLDALADGGYGALTIEGVAARSGVAKTTIYRWWPSKAALVIDAIAPVFESVNPVAGAAGDDLRADLLAAVRRVIDGFQARLEGVVMAGLVADLARDPEMAEAYRERIVRPRRAAVTALLEEWQDRGRIRADADLEVVQDLYVGPIYYRSLVTGATVDDAFADALVDALLAHVALPIPTPENRP